MAGWHHWLDGSEFEWTPGVGDGQGGLVCCDSWGRKKSDTTERLVWSSSDTESLRGLFATQAEMSIARIWGRSWELSMHMWKVSKQWVYTRMWKMPVSKVWWPCRVQRSGRWRRTIKGTEWLISEEGGKARKQGEAKWRRCFEGMIRDDRCCISSVWENYIRPKWGNKGFILSPFRARDEGLLPLLTYKPENFWTLSMSFYSCLQMEILFWANLLQHFVKCIQ